MKTEGTKTLGKGLVLHQFLRQYLKVKIQKKNKSKKENRRKKENFDSCRIVCDLSHFPAEFDSPKRG
jgi:hypothetical protein